jgi:dGTPase
LTQHDGIHTRLTHSLEVSCIGRSLGMLAAEKSKMNYHVDFTCRCGAIIQAACLAHDIGNPPLVMQVNMRFVNGLMMPHIVTFKKLLPKKKPMFVSLKVMHKVYVYSRIDYHPDDGGMRLTYATLGAYLKYPWLSKTIAYKAIVHPIKEQNLVAINLKKKF